MAIDAVIDYFTQLGIAERVRVLEESSATVPLAAKALGTELARIAKTLAFKTAGGCLLLLAAGDARVDNTRFKATFGVKAKMLTPEEALSITGHAIGGVCPFGIGEDIPVYLDASMQRFETVFPACGSANSAIELTLDELFRYASARAWVDVCKGWQEDTV